MRLIQYATKCMKVQKDLLFIAVTNFFLSFQGLRLIRFPLAGFNGFLSTYWFIFFVVLYLVGVNSFLSIDYSIFVAFMDLVR